jgi:2-polyprenyl-3-methyl-5-hydroxy-6-metoxy-1,4-benzoquinol methylase
MKEERLLTVTEKEHWNQIPWSRDKALKFDEIMGHFCVKTVLEYGKRSKLLDIGCGEGSLTVQFEPYYSMIVGVDASKKNIDVAKKKYANRYHIRYDHSLIEEFLPTDKFDTISMVNLLEHVIDPISILKRISNWLSSKGVIIIIVPNTLALTRRIATKMKILKNEYELTEWNIKIAGHRRVYDLKLLKTHIQRAGLKEINSGGIFQKTISSPQMDYLLDSNLWDRYNYGWGGQDEEIDWRMQYCNSCYEVGKLLQLL